MAGFKISRPDGSIAIDASYANLALRQKGTIVLDEIPNPSTPAFKGKTLSLNGDQAIIAYRSTSPVAIYSGIKQGGVFSYIFRGMNNNEPISVDWFLFDLPQYGLMYSVGGKLIVRRPGDGAVMFDSRMKYLKVQEFFMESDGAQSDVRRSYSKSPAVVMVNRAWFQSGQFSLYNHGVVASGSSMARIEGNQTVTGGKTTIAYPVPPSQEQSYYRTGGYPAYIVVDVENI